jgi:DNA-binding NarL/FixJ family response regulator
LYAQKAWQQAHAAFIHADAQQPLTAPDLWRVTWCCGLIGREREMIDTLERIYHASIAATDALGAARSAFWAGYRLLPMGEASRSSGWFARAERAIAQAGCECVEQGYLLLPEMRRQFLAGDYAAAQVSAQRAERIGEQFAELDLCVFARNFQGRLLLRLGQIAAGLKLLDEAMLAVTGGQLSPGLNGLIYCSAIDTCQSVYAIERAREWTRSLSDWCAAQPELVTFTGACMVARAEILQFGGHWPEAAREADHAVQRYLVSIGVRATGEARYRQAELQRLRGDFTAAEENYREASQQGRDPQPGLALLRLAQGKADQAASALRRAADAAHEPVQRAKLLPELVQVLLAAGATEEARARSNELESVAESFDSELLRALAGHARARVELAQDDPKAAAISARVAFLTLQQVRAPYLAAQARVTLACACQRLGDEDGALLEAQAARAVFHELGAAPDVAALDALTARAQPTALGNSAGLTQRELEVLRLVASGKTNKAIARELCLSEKTVDRHLSNILAKLDVPSRAGATAYAYQHKLW